MAQKEKVTDVLEKFKDSDKKIESRFLRDYYEAKSKNTKGFNPRDPLGVRLTDTWKAGDTIFSVTVKKYFNFWKIILDPDTYTVDKLNKKIRRMQMYDVYIYGWGAIISMFALTIIPFILPRIKQARTDYLMNQYLKKRWMEEEFKVEKKEVRMWRMKKMLRKLNEENS